MPDYDITALQRGIEACKKNILIFDGAIEKERATIKEYYEMIDILERKKQIANTVIKIPVEREN